MKNIILVVFLALGLSNCSKDEKNGALTENESSDLKFLREEEKLARDVYMYAYNKYQVAIFDNIFKSEQKHMDAVLNILSKYEILDPASTEVGVFVNPELQLTYNDLVSKVNISLTEALKVGATIEDLDINDINAFISNTTKNDLLKVYGNLNCGSKNHIRSFTAELTNNGITYVPQFISIETYNSILSSPNESCGKN
jgi:hypothetical protein